MPVLPYALGAGGMGPAAAATLAALFGCGALVARLTARPWWYGGGRQAVLGAAAAAVTYSVGTLVGEGLASWDEARRGCGAGG